MILISYNSGSLIRDEQKHLSDSNIRIDVKQMQYVNYIIADGEEASHIQQIFTSKSWKPEEFQQISIPWNFKSSGNTQIWFGDIAKTILANL